MNSQPLEHGYPPMITRPLFLPQVYLPNINRKKTIRKINSDQIYKGSKIVNYNSRVVIWSNFKSGMTLEL